MNKQGEYQVSKKVVAVRAIMAKQEKEAWAWFNSLEHKKIIKGGE